MSNIITRNSFSLTPANLQEAMQYAEIMAKSTIIPKAYQGKAGDILVAVQMGAEVGLKPIQALQNIAVINGKPSVYGDALLALVQSNPVFEDISEHYDEKLQAAICTVKRKGQSEHTVTYSVEDAKKAGLFGKVGPWQTYPKRMLQMRARGFALRDKFADALGGLITAEEAQDYPIDVTPKTQGDSAKLDYAMSKQPTNQENKDEDSKEKAGKINELIALCKDNQLNVKEFTKFHNIDSNNIETVKNGVVNFELLKNEFMENDNVTNTY